jgi:hypothetical protein
MVFNHLNRGFKVSFIEADFLGSVIKSFCTK